MAKKMKYSFDLKQLCTPSMIYFVISAFFLALLGIQNLNGDNNNFKCGTYECNVFSKTIIFALYAVYILFWTFTLDLFCKAGYKEISWFILMIPFILFFVFLGGIMLAVSNRVRRTSPDDSGGMSPLRSWRARGDLPGAGLTPGTLRDRRRAAAQLARESAEIQRLTHEDYGN